MKKIRLICAAAGTALALCLAGNACALPAMEVQIDVLMAQAGDLKQLLNLNNNQQILWRQTESRMRAILDDRRRRRERMQSDLKRSLDDAHAELRDMAKIYDTEAELSHQEDRQMREMFLTINDALDDTQRGVVLHALNDQLLRVADRGCEPGKAEEPRNRGMGRQRPGGGGGGSGGGAGSGGTPQQ